MKRHARYGVFLTLTWLSACVPTTPGTGPHESGQVMHDYLKAGAAHLAKNEIGPAIDAFNNAHAFAPNRTEPLLALADLYQQRRYFGEAADALRQALALQPDRHAWRSRYWAMQWLRTPPLDGEQQQALTEEIEQFIHTGETSPDYLLAAYKGAVYIDHKPAQITLLGKLAAVQDKSVRAQTEALLRRQLRHMQTFSELERLGRIYHEHFPDSPAAALIRDLEVIFMDEAPWQERQRELQQAAATDLRATLRLASGLLARNQELEKVITLARQGLAAIASYAASSRCPQTPYCTPAYWQSEFHHLLASALLRLNRFAEAQTHFNAALKLDPNNAINHWGLGLTFLETQQTESARTHFRRAFQLDAPLAEAIAGDRAGNLPVPTSPIGFTDVTQAANLANIRVAQIAWGDYNNDGYDDLLLEGKILFRNTGNGGFINASQGFAAGGYRWVKGGVWGDYDNDGYLDIFAYSNHGSHILRNDQAGGFIDVTPDLLPEDPGFPATAAAWGDLDNDGFLDLVVINKRHERVFDLPCQSARIFRNDQAQRFVLIANGPDSITAQSICMNSLRWLDLDDDAFQDLVTTNADTADPVFWLNRQGRWLQHTAPPKFSRTAPPPSQHDPITPLFADFDNDGKAEILTRDPLGSPLSRLATLASTLPERPDTPAALRRYLQQNLTDKPWVLAEAGQADLDNDGDLDLVLAAGAGKNFSRLYLNDGQGRFTDVTWQSGFAVPGARRIALSDYDLDGDIDALMVTDSGLRLLRNELREKNHWVSLRFFDRQCNRFAVGATFKIRSAAPGQRRLHAGGGRGSQNSLNLHLGLANHRDAVILEVTNRCGQTYTKRLRQIDDLVIIKH